MKPIYFLSYLFSMTLLQVVPLSAQCPCQHPKSPKPESQFYSEHYTGCGCGSGGNVNDHQEIPPDQD